MTKKKKKVIELRKKKKKETNPMKMTDKEFRAWVVTRLGRL